MKRVQQGFTLIELLVIIAIELPPIQLGYGFTLNGVTLIGRTVAGLWLWECPEWPDLAREHSGQADSQPMLDAFHRLAVSTEVQ